MTGKTFSQGWGVSGGAKLELKPDDGEYIAALIMKIYATPKPIVAKISSLIK
ncbi:MAG TPA: hypothetical protein VFV12_10840 [Xanthobacteraceae bacterium]|nr:hypothetical protein [Xanthobacteraceae bacterium]